MAQDTEIVLDVKIKAAESANTVKELKSSLKGLKDELNNVEAGSAQFKKLSKSINETEGKIGDLNDSFNTLKGSGIERTTSSINLLKEGFATFDIGKIGTAFKGLGAAMKAIPIFLIVEGITYLVTNFKELSQGSGLLAKALRVVGDVIQGAVDLLYEFTDLIGLTNSELDKQGEAIKEYADKTTEALAQQSKEFDNQIRVAKAAGKSTVELEIAKQQAIIDTNKLILEQIIAFVRAGGELDEEKKKLFNASTQFIKDARVEQKVIEINHNKEVNAEYKKSLDEKKKEADKQLEDNKKRADEWLAYQKQAQKDIDDYIHNTNLEARKRLETKREEEKAFDDEELNAGFDKVTKGSKYDVEATKKAEEDKRAEKQKTVDDALAATQKGLQAAQQLTDLYFARQLKQNKGNAAAELEIRKKQFKVNKAFGITMAVIDGARGVQSALAMGPPLGYIFAAISAVLAGVQIAKIASSKFEGGESSASAGDVGGGISTGSAPALPQPNNTVTKIDDDGKVENKQPVVKAIVVESDMTEKQQRVNTIQESAKFG